MQACSKSAETTRDVTQRVDEQLKTAAIANYRIELDEPAERPDGSVFRDDDVRAALIKKGFANPTGEWVQCTVNDIKTVLTELHTGIKLSGTRQRIVPPCAPSNYAPSPRPTPTFIRFGKKTCMRHRAFCGTPKCASARPLAPTTSPKSSKPNACWW
jgi:hypothetical protein